MRTREEIEKDFEGIYYEDRGELWLTHMQSQYQLEVLLDIRDLLKHPLEETQGYTLSNFKPHKTWSKCQDGSCEGCYGIHCNGSAGNRGL